MVFTILMAGLYQKKSVIAIDAIVSFVLSKKIFSTGTKIVPVGFHFSC